MLRKHWLLLLFGLVNGVLLPILWFSVVEPWRAETEANASIIAQATRLAQSIGATETAWKLLTPSPIPSITPTPTQAPTLNVYTVVEGDILGTIAEQFGISVDDLLAANPGIGLETPLFPGDQLIIPSPGNPLAATAVPATSDAPMARVSAEGDGLRLRETPGTEGTVIAYLDAFTLLNLVGRTADNTWLEVTTPTNLRGWVSADLIETNISLATVPVTGEVLEPTETPNR